jgi:hypothetical protein
MGIYKLRESVRRILNLQQKDSPVIGSRLVFHFGGYDPVSPTKMYSRFVRELTRFRQTWSVASSASALLVAADRAKWTIVSNGPNWRVETDHQLFRWDDIMAGYAHRPVWWRLPMGLLAFADFVAGGVLWGYARTNWRYALFFLYPYLLLLVMVVASSYAAELAARTSGSIAIGIAAGVLTFIAFYLGPGRWAYLPVAFDDWIFSRSYIRHSDPELERRLDAVADEIISAARARSVDEILLFGHSLGAVLAVDVLDRAFSREPDLGSRGPRLVLVTAGSSILKIGLHRAAGRLRDALARVSRSPGVFWVDYQALTDVMNFYKTDPVRECGLEPTGRPIIRTVRISRMLEPESYRRVRRNLYRVHCQFVSGNERRTAYDYFMLLCGPLPAEQQARSDEGAASEIDDNGRLLHAAAPSADPARTQIILGR